jgi:glutamate--cysteine ligase
LNKIDANGQAINREFCRHYVDEHIFKLRPQDYNKKYPKWPGAVGFEVEMLPVIFQGDGRRPALVPLQGAADTLASCLRRLARRRDWSIEESPGLKDSGSLLMRILMDQGDALTFEPGGQLEFSSIPYPCLADAIKRLEAVQADLTESLSPCEIELLQIGCNPWYRAPEVGLQMPKARYEAMDRYFASIGPWGEVMMRLTCSVQVCLDFGPTEEIMARRFLVAQLISPFATAIFANSPFMGGKISDMRTHRSKSWRHLDPSRSGGPAGLEKIQLHGNKNACAEVYTDFLLGARVVFVESLDYRVMTKSITFAEWIDQGIDGVRPTLKDLETHLSLLFPEVRARGFLEMRSIDCQSRIWQTVPAAFYTGLLYDEQSLNACHELLTPLISAVPELLGQSVFGLQNDAISSVALKLMDVTVEGFSRMPGCFLSEGSLTRLIKFREHFTARGRTPADDWLDAFAAGGGEISGRLIADLEGRWQELVV